MKKLIMILACLILSAAGLAGCANNAQSFTEESFAADANEIKGIVLDVQERLIEIAPSEDDQVHIEYYSSSKEYYDLSVSQDNILTMRAVQNKSWTDYIGVKVPAQNRKIFLRVPDGLLASLTVSTTKENILIEALSVSENLSLYTNGGNITFERLNAGNGIELQAKNGDISGCVAGSYEDYSISCSFKKGKSNLPEYKESGVKTLKVENNNGDINIQFTGE